MPITHERQTLQDLRAARFNRQQDLKEFMRQELAQFRQEINPRFAELRTEMHATRKDLPFKLIGTIVAAISLAVAVIKLFPGAH